MCGPADLSWAGGHRLAPIVKSSYGALDVANLRTSLILVSRFGRSLGLDLLCARSRRGAERLG